MNPARSAVSSMASINGGPVVGHARPLCTNSLGVLGVLCLDAGLGRLDSDSRNGFVGTVYRGRPIWVIGGRVVD